ncbi:MAG: tetratricopeptide repeat protein [Bacteroidia bacterium]|nr:tetratricopeptide repeat protein [Bacteroidia bacterium]
MKKTLSIVFIVFCSVLLAQTEKIEKNIALLKTAKTDTEKVKLMTELCSQLSQYDTEKSLQYGKDGLALAKKADYAKGIAIAYTNMGITLWYMGRLDECEKNFKTALDLHLDLKDSFMIGRDFMNLGSFFLAKGEYDSALYNYNVSLEIKKKSASPYELAQTYHNIALVYGNMGNYNKSLEQYFTALKIVEKAGHKKGIAMTMNNIGNIYFDMKKEDKALDYYLKSIKLKEELNSPPLELALGYNNIANIYNKQEKDSLTLFYYSKALDLRVKASDSAGIAAIYNNYGLFYENKRQFKLAEEYHKKSLIIREHQGNPEEILQSYINLGTVYKWMQDPAQSIASYNKALVIAQKIGTLKWVTEIYSGLADIYGNTGKFNEAYRYEKLFNKYSDSLLNQENEKQVMEMESKYKSEKKQLEIDNLNKASALKDTEMKMKDEKAAKQNIMITFFAVGFILVLGLAFFAYRGYRLKRKSNLALEFQKALVEEKQKELLDSIYYARRIQHTLLTSEKYIERVLVKLKK